ncbi:hypothetical protein RchiOBHm_Chr5g0061881 [Rosa chinensis]|uniref:Uncharacterized protein n=1 Tax=Rosa chinensis TaxID=74649 RepID=A0A2P6QI19_ROSCH|nr:protein PXR1 [Rosa chinensis]PRQ33822.1 hypothetical protein RchiOBHm_Chr5g0061881 [Rosa chinensis]
MKTVQSRVLSSDPISLSDATSFLSDFNRSVCGGGGGASVGASHETCWFVRRALASFEELEQLYRKLKDPRSDRKGRHPGSETRNDDVETTVGQSFVASRDVSAKPKSHRQRESDDVNRKVEVEEQSKGGNRILMEDGGEIAERVGVEIDDKKKKKKKREEDGESEMGNGEVKREIGFRDFEQDESQNKKKKKKKRDNVDEKTPPQKEEDGESEMGSEEVKRQEKKKKKKKKRKSEVLENGEIDALEEQQEKRKKRRKS